MTTTGDNSKSVVYISLGSDCCIAYHLQRLGLREYGAFPFDWVYTKRLKNLLHLFENNFNGFLDDPSIITTKNKSSKFQKLNNDDDYLLPEISNQSIINNETTTRVINTKYNIEFVHDFSNFDMDELAINKDKYARRIERFNKIMRDESIQKKLFRIGSSNEIDIIPKLYKCFSNDTLNYKNYNIYFKSYADLPSNTTDWQRNEFNFQEWFSTSVHKDL